MKVLALITDGFGGSGGIARYNRDLFAALSESKAVKSVIALPRSGGATEAPIPKITQLAGYSGRIAWSLAALRLVKREKFDVLFCGHANAVRLAAVAARLGGCRLWLQIHGVEAWENRGGHVRKALRAADLVTSVSRFTRQRFLGWSDVEPARVKVLPNVVDPMFVPRPRPRELAQRLGLEGNKVLLTVGRLAAGERYKGHDKVIAALSRLVRSEPNLCYLIVGDGTDRPRLEQCARDADVEKRVIFAGDVSAADLLDMYALADVFVMPSVGEGFGIVFMEAAACGLPVIGGNADGSVDALAEGRIGTPVSPGDTQALDDSILAALARGRSGACADVERFAFSNFSRQVDELLGHIRA